MLKAVSLTMVTYQTFSPFCETFVRDSTYLFIICIELLSNKITTTKDIKGITTANYEFKKFLFVDDASFILDGSLKSFETLVDILDNFSYISGLKINSNKCQK